MSNACHNRPPFAPSVRVADGWESSWARNMVDMEFRMEKGCIYSSSDLGQADKGCTGCRWRANGQADTGAEAPAEPVPESSGLAGAEGADGLRESAEVAEHGSSGSEARAAEELEAIHPAARIYRRAE